MVSYEELIYYFTDIYLKTAMECSICKENYTMADDTEFLDEYMKFFESLLLSIEKDETLDLEDVKETLERRKRQKLLEFQIFLKRKAIEEAVEVAKKIDNLEGSMVDNAVYIEEIQRFYTGIFDDKSEEIKDSPISLLRYMRTKEENL